MTRVLYLLPVAAAKRPHGSAEMTKRQIYLQQLAGPGVTVEVWDIEEGPLSIESSADERQALPATLKTVTRAEQAGFEAVILGCFSDLGLHEARRHAKIPVIGPAESSFFLASVLGRSFGVVTSTEGAIPLIENVLRWYQLEHRCSAIRAMGTPVLQMTHDPAETRNALLLEGRNAVRSYGISTLVLGCMSLGFLGLAEQLAESLQIPVVCPVRAALAMAEISARSRFKKQDPQHAFELLAQAGETHSVAKPHRVVS